MATKKWAQNVELKEGALKAIGWPSASAIEASISSGKVSYATAMRRLNFIANMGNKKAKAIIVRLKKSHGTKKPKAKK